jgi:hypothetical protein
VKLQYKQKHFFWEIFFFYSKDFAQITRFTTYKNTLEPNRLGFYNLDKDLIFKTNNIQGKENDNASKMTGPNTTVKNFLFDNYCLRYGTPILNPT